MGKEKAVSLVPAIDGVIVKSRLAETSESKRILSNMGRVPLDGIYDIRSSLRKASIGGILAPDEFLRIASLLNATNNMKRFCQQIEEQDFPIIWDLASKLYSLSKLKSTIDECISPDGLIKDSASPELNKARKQIRNKQAELKSKLDQIIRSTVYQKYLQEPLVTIRNDRHVVPVKQEYRSNVPGILHDQSASGATLYIEPMAVVEINNKVRQLQAIEEKEIEKILKLLTESVQEDASLVQMNMEVLATLDFIFAKGKLSVKMDGTEPGVNSAKEVNIYQGKHPLIEGEVVPIDIRLGGDFDILVVTGPNTGGKTVTLKTLGLFTCMSQAGLHIPAREDSSITIFKDVFVDIGDEQSIEQSLSTFSSHMTNIISILMEADSSSLVLFDELGAGTDPTEGAALAMAILEYLYNKNIKAVATTHYSELKAFAYQRERVENASVEFDSKTLRPTYKLLIGVPGKSNAFEISARLGLKREIVETARSFLTQEEVKVADLIKNLEENQMASERERLEAETIKGNLERQLEAIKREKDEIERKKEEVIRSAHLKANEILDEAKKEANKFMKELKQLKTESLEEQKKAAQQGKSKIDQLKQSNQERATEKEKHTESESPKKVNVGDTVYLPAYNQKGEVLTKPNANDEIQVQAGILKLSVKLSEVRLTKEDKKDRGQISTKGIVKEKAMNIKTEVDLRGYKAEQAIYELDKYIDDAYVAGLSFLNVIHGKGTGALRQAITEYLRNHPQVKSIRLGDNSEGGSGVTVVEF